MKELGFRAPVRLSGVAFFSRRSRLYDPVLELSCKEFKPRNF